MPEIRFEAKAETDAAGGQAEMTISTHPSAIQDYRIQTDRIAAMYGFRFPCKKCGKSSAPAGRKKLAKGWMCAECAKPKA